MGLLDSITKAAKEIFEESEEEKQERKSAEAAYMKSETLRNPLRSCLQKDRVSEEDFAFLQQTAAKLGIGADEFKMRFRMVQSAKEKYYGQEKKGIFSSKSPDLFFKDEDEVEEYYMSKAKLASMTELGEMQLEQKVMKEMQRPHFDSAFDEAFPPAIFASPDNGQQQQNTPAPPMPQVQYSLNINGQNYGPYDMQQLQQMVQSGQLTRQTYVWKQGMANWDVAGNVQELSSLFGVVPPPPPATPPAPPTM